MAFTDDIWAMKAAYQDSSYLISPMARARALNILMSAEAVAVDPDKQNAYGAAINLLQDGGEQQGSNVGPYHGDGAMTRWSNDLGLVKRHLTMVELGLD